ncbi:MAG: SH3 domain-containing protein [Pseudomonadota bacterium]|nr:SH3 domain-containing protein [Pseudomonadota bacterium]
MKASNGSSGSTASSGPATAPSAGRTSNPPSPRAEAIPAGGFALAGPSALPDPATSAYRKDLADIALAGRVIASHYAEPLPRHLAEDAPLFARPAEDEVPLAMLRAGDLLEMLDCSRGWAWGYAGDGQRVGYVRASALKP